MISTAILKISKNLSCSVLKLLQFIVMSLFAIVLLVVIPLLIAYIYFAPELPSSHVLKQVQFQVPLMVYSKQGDLIAKFGEQKRIPKKFEQIPPQMIHAFLAAEDANFYQHYGVDLKGLFRAAIYLVLTRKKKQGGSTITKKNAPKNLRKRP